MEAESGPGCETVSWDNQCVLWTAVLWRLLESSLAGGQRAVVTRGSVGSRLLADWVYSIISFVPVYSKSQVLHPSQGLL